MALGWIYKITNNINNKVYIGQTTSTLRARWIKHCNVAKNGRDGQAPTGIDGAIRKYGEENFVLEAIEQCPIEELNDKEIYWINFYNSYNTGYNLTLGGGGSQLYSFDLLTVKEKYAELGTIKALSKYYDCGVRTISDFLHNNNIEVVKPVTNLENLQKGRKFQKGDGAKPIKIKELEKEFSSEIECAQWLIDNNSTRSKNVDNVRKKISESLTGYNNKTSYLGYHFEYL
jgi:group I intron endonuclease